MHVKYTKSPTSKKSSVDLRCEVIWKTNMRNLHFTSVRIDAKAFAVESACRLDSMQLVWMETKIYTGQFPGTL